MKIDVFVLNKLLMSLKDDVSDVFNHNTGTLLIKNVKIVPLELIIHIKTKVVNLVQLMHLYGMENIV